MGKRSTRQPACRQASIPAGHGRAAGAAPAHTHSHALSPLQAPRSAEPQAAHPQVKCRCRLTRGLAGALHHRPRAEQPFASPLWHFANSFGEPCIPRPANAHLAASKARTPPPPHSCRSRASGSVGPAGLAAERSISRCSGIVQRTPNPPAPCRSLSATVALPAAHTTARRLECDACARRSFDQVDHARAKSRLDCARPHAAIAPLETPPPPPSNCASDVRPCTRPPRISLSRRP